MDSVLIPNDSIVSSIKDSTLNMINSYFGPNFTAIDGTLKWIIGVLVVNIVLLIIKWCFEYRLKLKDVEVSRKTIIEGKKLASEQELFNKINELFSIVEFPDNTFRLKIEEINTYI